MSQVVAAPEGSLAADFAASEEASNAQAEGGMGTDPNNTAFALPEALPQTAVRAGTCRGDRINMNVGNSLCFHWLVCTYRGTTWVCIGRAG